MEVDGVSWPTESQSSKEDMFAHMKEFVSAAREFYATHSEASISDISRSLGLIASSTDSLIFSPGHVVVSTFFSSLWRVTSDPRGPHWPCVAVLVRIAKDAQARHALTHTYKFLSALSHLLTDSLSLERKMTLLSLMQDITYGIRISFQESFLPPLLKQLTDWVASDPPMSTLGWTALSVLVNICQGNMPAQHALQRIVDVKQFVTRLINMKDDGFGGTEVCRLLLCLSSAARSHRHVHSYLSCATSSLCHAISERDSTQLLHVYMFMNDLCNDQDMKAHVITYPDFTKPVSDAVKSSLELCNIDHSNAGVELECLEHTINCLTLLTKLELFSLRGLHSALLEICLKASRLVLPASIQLLIAVLSQYKEEGRLPQDVAKSVSEKLPALLVPPTQEIDKAGIPWINLVAVLCDFTDLQDRILNGLNAAVFEETFFNVLQYLHQNSGVSTEESQQAAVTGCRAALSLAPHSREWDAALSRLLAHHQVCSLLTLCLTNTGARRKQVLQLVKHPHFPPDKINQVFSSQPDATSLSTSLDSSVSRLEASRTWGQLALSDSAVDEWPAMSAHTRLHNVDSLIQSFSKDSHKQKDMPTSSMMELFLYKISCLEMQLNSQQSALKAATEHTATLQHTIAMLRATGASQQEALFTQQLDSERQKKKLDHLNAQLVDAEKSVRGFRTKLAAERQDKDNQIAAMRNSQRSNIATLEAELKSRDKELAEKQAALENMQAEVTVLNGKLQQQSTKNSELAGVLVKFEDRVKARDRKLEEVAATEAALRKELEHKEQSIKQLEKTVLERENRLYQVTNQLEEMRRVQDMVAKLMGSAKPATS